MNLVLPFLVAGLASSIDSVDDGLRLRDTALSICHRLALDGRLTYPKTCTKQAVAGFRKAALACHDVVDEQARRNVATCFRAT
jgi:hypothetical protein